MKGIYLKLTALTLALILAATSVQAGRVAGGDISYKNIGGTNYEVTVVFYRNCSGSLAPSSPSLTVIRGDTCSNSTTILSLKNNNSLTVTCPASTTTCSGGSYLGVEKYTYKDTVDVQVSCAQVYFRFQIASRSSDLTNLATSGGTYDMYLESFLYAGPVNGRSPQFNSDPVFVVPNNQKVQLDLSATGQTNDSLVYVLEQPLYAPGAVVPYEAGYSLSNPMLTNGTFYLNAQTGQLTFNSTQDQHIALSIKVHQYRNGNLVGISHRDIEIVTDDNANVNTPPTLSGINGTNSVATAVAGGDTVQFTIYTDDMDAAQQLTASIAQSPAALSANIVPGQHPAVQVYWETTILDTSTRPYQFTVSVADDGCPYIQRSTRTYYIYVHNPAGDVWPGDVNNDLVVDMLDLLPIGAGFTATGPVRPGGSNSWTAQTSADWTQTFVSGINYKFADCNGDGTIDSLDTQAILNNYNLGHNKQSSLQSSQSGPPLYMNPTVDTILAGGTLFIPVHLGSPTTAAGDVYGVTFSINYNSDYVVPGSAQVVFDSCWMNDGLGIITLFKELPNENRIDVGITRTNHISMNGNGELCIVSVVMQDDITGKSDIFATVEFGLGNAHLVTPEGYELPVATQDTSLIIQDVVSTGPELGKTIISLYPNPAGETLFIKTSTGMEGFTMYNSTGRVVKSANYNATTQQVVDLGMLPDGIYLVSVTDVYGQVHVQRIVKENIR